MGTIGRTHAERGKRRCANWRRQTPSRRLSHLASIWQSASRHLPGDEAYSPTAQLWAPLHFAKCEKGLAVHRRILRWRGDRLGPTGAGAGLLLNMPMINDPSAGS